jgi:hypothetical protein
MPIEFPNPEAAPPKGAYDVPVGRDEPELTGGGGGFAKPPAHGKAPFSVRLGIAAAMIISLLAAGVLYYKWYKDRPDANQTTVIVWGKNEKDWDGATVTVTNTALGGETLMGELSEKENLLLRFHVQPGNYRVRIEKEGHKLAEIQSDPRRPLLPNMIWWPFHAPPAATQQIRK